MLAVRKSINDYEENEYFSKARIQETPPRRQGTNKNGIGESLSTAKKAVQTKQISLDTKKGLSNRFSASI